MVMYYSERWFFKKKRFLQWQCLNPGLAGTGAAPNPSLYPWQTSIINYDTLPLKPTYAF